MSQPTSPARKASLIALAVAAAVSTWFIARDAKPVLPLAQLKDLLRPSASALIQPAAAAPHPELPEVDFVGLLAVAGSKPHALKQQWVSLNWRAKEPTLVTDGRHHPLLMTRMGEHELQFEIADLYGRPGRWQFHLRIDGSTLAGPVTAPDDPLLGGYMLVSQAVTRKVIPPPPIVSPRHAGNS